MYCPVNDTPMLRYQIRFSQQVRRGRISRIGHKLVDHGTWLPSDSQGEEKGTPL